jgi:hypothetical protein
MIDTPAALVADDRVCRDAHINLRDAALEQRNAPKDVQLLPASKREWEFNRRQILC